MKVECSQCRGEVECALSLVIRDADWCFDCVRSRMADLGRQVFRMPIGNCMHRWTKSGWSKPMDPPIPIYTCLKCEGHTTEIQVDYVAVLERRIEILNELLAEHKDD